MAFFFSGSQSKQFEQSADSVNPLPPCPDSPNCVRLSRKYDMPAPELLKTAESCLQEMKPLEMEVQEKEGRITAVFKIFIYKDDLKLMIEESGESSALLHIHSSSRKGYSDIGVNRRRVKRFLKLINKY